MDRCCATMSVCRRQCFLIVKDAGIGVSFVWAERLRDPVDHRSRRCSKSYVDGRSSCPLSDIPTDAERRSMTKPGSRLLLARDGSLKAASPGNSQRFCCGRRPISALRIFRTAMRTHPESESAHHAFHVRQCVRDPAQEPDPRYESCSIDARRRRLFDR